MLSKEIKDRTVCLVKLSVSYTHAKLGICITVCPNCHFSVLRSSVTNLSVLFYLKAADKLKNLSEVHYKVSGTILTVQIHVFVNSLELTRCTTPNGKCIQLN